MKQKSKFVVVFVTAPSLRVARALAKAALESKVVACANLIPKLESHYWWQGKIEKSAEVLILFKTAARNTSKLQKLILDEHPYDTPEFVVVEINSGTKRYLQWIESSTI